MSSGNEGSRSYPRGELESPFLDEELLVGETATEWEPRVAALEAESPIESAFLQRWAPAGVADLESVAPEEDLSRSADGPPEVFAERPEDFTGSDSEEDELALLHEQPLEERFDPSATPKEVSDALGRKDWPRALELAIQAGWRDENELANLLFFARHPELPPERLDPKGPGYRQLSAEWIRIRDNEVWKTIETSAENTDLVVSGKEVTDHHRTFFRGRSAKRLKKLIADAAREVDLNPGLLGTIMMAETRRPLSYLSNGKVSSYHIGTDDFYEGRAAIRARVPAYAKVKWDKNQTPSEHYNDAQRNPRIVKTILFDSGPDAALATAVYAKFYEVRLREIAASLKEDFNSLPLATRFALTRMAMAAGAGGATPFLQNALKGVDIFVRRDIPVRAYQTQRNATVRTAQAMHLSDWVFGIPVPAAVAPSQPEAFEGFDDHEHELTSEEREDDAGSVEEDIDPELAEEVEHPDHEMADDAPSFELLVPKVSLSDLRTRIDEYFDLAKATYFLSGGTAVSARPQFRYAKAGGTEAAIARVGRILGKAFEKKHPKAIYMAAYGRARPSEIAAITQALIDAGELSPVRAADNEQRVRALQREFKMGIDCAGYVQLAFIHAFTGSDDDPPSLRRSLGLHERRGWERLAELPGGHFTKVDVHDAQTGDLFVMKPRAGSRDRSWHTVLIVDHTVAGTVHTFLCDASWGTDLYGAAAGGVARRELKHDTSTGEWWDVNPVSGIDAYKNTTGPYNGHPIHGMFRAKPEK